MVEKRKNKNDECYTLPYAIYPLFKYLKRFKSAKIWCPFDTDESNFVKILRENGYTVINSHISDGRDFFKYEPAEWDLIVSNPPFSNKRETFTRAMKFNKPFALLMSLDWLNDKAPFEIFGKELQLLMFDDRMVFDNQLQLKRIPFKAIYYCRGFLPNSLEWMHLQDKEEQMSLWQNAQISERNQHDRH